MGRWGGGVEYPISLFHFHSTESLYFFGQSTANYTGCTYLGILKYSNTLTSGYSSTPTLTSGYSSTPIHLPRDTQVHQYTYLGILKYTNTLSSGYSSTPIYLPRDTQVLQYTYLGILKYSNNGKVVFNVVFSSG